MMLAWVADLLMASGLLGLAAVFIEQILRSHHRQTRAPWLAAMAASFIVPFLGSWIATNSAATPNLGAAGAFHEPKDPAVKGSPWIDLGASPKNLLIQPQNDRLIVWIWLSSMVLAGSIVTIGALQFWLRRRTWRKGAVVGVPVLIAPDAGPAVFGILRPQIVVPEWLLNEPIEVQRYVMAHEGAHAHAHDPSVLALSIVLVLLAPWNPLLWWQLRRLRIAVEIDCDRRVLLEGADPRRYAQVLLHFVLRRASLLGATTAISESPSTLERRISAMLQPRKALWTLGSALLASLALGSVLAATKLAPPPPMLALAAASGQLSPMEGYVGSYEFASVTVLEIRRQGDQLSAVFSDQSADPLTERSPDEFRYRDGDWAIHFKRDTSGTVSGLSFEQNGAVTYAPRITAARVQTIQGQIAERYRRQVAAPGSENSLRGLIEGIQSGKPNYAKMSPQLGGGTRTMLKSFQSSMQPFGSIQSIEFKGVNKAGWDQYHVKHAHGAADWQIALDDKGIVVGALVNSDS